MLKLVWYSVIYCTWYSFLLGSVKLLEKILWAENLLCGSPFPQYYKLSIHTFRLHGWCLEKKVDVQLSGIQKDLFTAILDWLVPPCPLVKIERCEVNVLGLIIHKSQHIQLCGCAARSIKSVWYKFLNLKGILNQNCFKLVWFV